MKANYSLSPSVCLALVLCLSSPTGIAGERVPISKNTSAADGIVTAVGEESITIRERKSKQTRQFYEITPAWADKVGVATTVVMLDDQTSTFGNIKVGMRIKLFHYTTGWLDEYIKSIRAVSAVKRD